MPKNPTMPTVPLAERMRPAIIDDIVGQAHLIGPGKPVAQMLQKGSLFSMILWGPPGSGKTTLARVLCESVKGSFVQLSAISSGVKDLRAVISDAKKLRASDPEKRIVLFIDEIHRFNKAQQDALLQAVEQGDIVLIGATTENPSFEVIPPLRSRTRIYVLDPLSISDLEALLHRAMESDDYLNKIDISFEDEQMLIAYSGGDARALLNGLEMCCILAEENGKVTITQEILEEAFQRAFTQYDKGGEEHYNVISAFIKSVRGSDPDAALYWMARMIDGGEDPLFIARRLIILASEDIGNADPNALLLATSCFQAVHSVGMPEARIVLSQVTTYLASTQKSNAAYQAIKDAQEDVSKNPPYPVPLHLRNAPTKLMKNLDYGKGYKYAHSYDGHWVEQEHLPPELTGKQYYKPTDIGREKVLKDRLQAIWKKRKY
jgi:putative ATPase